MNCNFLVDEIKALKNDEELKASKASIENKRKSFENQKNYLSAKEDLNQAIKNVENLMKKSGSVADFDKQFELALTEIKKCVGVKRITDSEYNLNYRTVMRGKFWAVGKKSEYNDMITRLISPISKRLVKFNHIDRD
jgi:hypothetical protein